MRKLVSRMYGNGATVIPKKVREALDIKAGDIIVWRIDRKKKVAVISVEKDVLSELSKNIVIKGRWAGKLYRSYVATKKSKK